MKRTTTLLLTLFLGTTVGCGAADPGADEAIGETAEAISASGHDAFWWDDIMDDVDNVTVAPNVLDQFQVSAGNVIHWRLSSGAWSGGAAMSRPAGVTFKAIAAANTGGFIDIFALGSNNRIWHRFASANASSVGTFSNWEQVANTGNVLVGSKLAMTSSAAGVMDVFWITSSRTIGHASFVNFAPTGVESGTGWLQNLPGIANGNIEAVSWGPGRIDLFLWDSGDVFNIHHHFKDNGSSGRAEYRAGGTGIVDTDLGVTSLAVTSSGPNQLGILVRPDPNEPQSTVSNVRFANISGLLPNRSNLSFEPMTGILGSNIPAAPLILLDIVRRVENGVVKNELWGGGDVRNSQLYSAWFGD
jgi:hypothetical protein